MPATAWDGIQIMAGARARANWQPVKEQNGCAVQHHRCDGRPKHFSTQAFAQEESCWCILHVIIVRSASAGQGPPSSLLSMPDREKWHESQVSPLQAANRNGGISRIEIPAGALNLVGDRAIYGRNWGCHPACYVKHLHFELCYYMVRATHLAHSEGVGQAACPMLASRIEPLVKTQRLCHVLTAAALRGMLTPNVQVASGGPAQSGAASHLGTAQA